MMAPCGGITGGEREGGGWLGAGRCFSWCNGHDIVAAMEPKQALFDTINPAAEAAADARAEADVREGRLISHAAVKRWIASWGSAVPLARPEVGA